MSKKKRAEQSTEGMKVYIDEDLRERMLIHLARNRKYANNSVFIREAIREKLDRDEKK